MSMAHVVAKHTAEVVAATLLKFDVKLKALPDTEQPARAIGNIRSVAEDFGMGQRVEAIINARSSLSPAPAMRPAGPEQDRFNHMRAHLEALGGRPKGLPPAAKPLPPEHVEQVRKLFLQMQDLVSSALDANGPERRALLHKAADAQADLKDHLSTLRRHGGATGAYQQAANFLGRELGALVGAQPEAKTTLAAVRADTDSREDALKSSTASRARMR